MICSILSLSMAVAAQTKTITIKVAGNCEMCQSKIEQSALGAGATSAAWDADLKQLSITMEEKANSLDIEKAIAAAGYDTEHIKGDATAYSNLPHCCQYERTADYSDAKAACCSTSSDSSTCCKQDDKSLTCCKHDGNHSTCCTADMSCCSAATTHQGEACCKDGKCTHHK